MSVISGHGTSCHNVLHLLIASGPVEPGSWLLAMSVPLKLKTLSYQLVQLESATIQAAIFLSRISSREPLLSPSAREFSKTRPDSSKLSFLLFYFSNYTFFCFLTFPLPRTWKLLLADKFSLLLSLLASLKLSVCESGEICVEICQNNERNWAFVYCFDEKEKKKEKKRVAAC